MAGRFIHPSWCLQIRSGMSDVPVSCISVILPIHNNDRPKLSLRIGYLILLTSCTGKDARRAVLRKDICRLRPGD